MPNPYSVEKDLEALLARPQFSSMIDHRNQFRNPKDPAETPASIAKATALALWQRNPLLDPVEVVELRGPVELYRAHDGGESRGSAGTLGRSWTERSVVRTIWDSTAKLIGDDRRNAFLEFFRTANFVLPEWNAMKFIVCMDVPSGASVAVVRGRGNWKAMRTRRGTERPGGVQTNIRSAGGVMDNAGMMPIPGTVQYLVPLFNDNWVVPVSYPSVAWPFLR